MQSIRTGAHIAVAALAALLITPSPAAADDLIVIPVSGSASGAEGDTVTIASVGVPDDVIGASCQITGSTVNQRSVHEGNDLLITTNGQTFVVPNFEDAGFIVHQAGTTTSVGATIQLAIRFGPDGVSSGGFRVSIDCDPVEPPTGPTTTEPTTSQPTTTEPTTTEPPTTEPTPPSTDVGANPPSTAAPTTAVPPVLEPSTTIDEPPAGPTTAAPTTTTTAPAPTTAVAPTSAPPSTAAEAPPAGPSADGGGALPVTGSTTGPILGAGLLLMAAGLLLRRFATNGQPGVS